MSNKTISPALMCLCVFSANDDLNFAVDDDEDDAAAAIREKRRIQRSIADWRA